MKNGVLIIKNVTREEPGILLDILMNSKIPFKVIDLDKDEKLPAVENYDALVVLGGPDSANDQSSKIINELKYIKNAVTMGIPYLGICLGLQLLVKSSGGLVVMAKTKEIGFFNPNNEQYNISLTEKGNSDPLFKGLGNYFNVFQLHGESVELTDKMTLLGYGTDCKNQIVKVGNNAYGIQCHFELTKELFNSLIKEDEELLVLDSKLLLSGFNDILDKYTEVGSTLFTNFLKISGVINE